MCSQSAGIPAPRDKAVCPGWQTSDYGKKGFYLILSSERQHVSCCLALHSTPFLHTPKGAQRKKAPSSAPCSPLLGHLLPHGMRVRACPSSVTLPGAHTLELNKKSESPTSEGRRDICLSQGGSAIFLPSPSRCSMQGKKKVQNNTELAGVSAELPKECSTKGSWQGGRGGFSGPSLFSSRLLWPLPGSIMPASPEAPLWVRRGRTDFTEPGELGWEEKAQSGHGHTLFAQPWACKSNPTGNSQDATLELPAGEGGTEVGHFHSALSPAPALLLPAVDAASRASVGSLSHSSIQY